MKKPRLRFLVASGVLALIAVILAGSSWGRTATTAGSPFYIPSATKECNKLAHCFGITGPWVVIPPHGEATFLFGCPVRSKTRGAFLLGGTDSLASSNRVRVWYDGQLGAPIGLPNGQNGPNSGLLFHAVTSDGNAASFQPILGCISLLSASKRSTVSARTAEAPPGTPHSEPPPHLHAQRLILEPGQGRSLGVSCLKHERLVGNWTAFGFGSDGPPKLPPAGAGTIQTTDVGKTVQAVIRTNSFVPYLIQVQVGAICEP
jgi:hypothetical protein